MMMDSKPCMPDNESMLFADLMPDRMSLYFAEHLLE